MSNNLTNKKAVEQYLTNCYKIDCFKEKLFETMKAIRSELPQNQVMKKVLLNRETFNALEKAHLSRLRFDARDGEADATLYGIPVEVDGSIAPGDIGYVIEVKTGEQP